MKPMYTLIVSYDHWTDDKYIRLRKDKNLSSLLATCLSFQRVAQEGVIFDVIDLNGQSMLEPKQTTSLFDELFKSLH